MAEEGYAAVSTRRIAQELGINGATVHYYYPTTDDVFVALHGRMMEAQVEGMTTVLSAEHPLQALWSFQTAWDRSALGIEFIALCNHRKSLRPLLAAATNSARDAQAQALAPVLESIGGDLGRLSPTAFTTMLLAIARTIANEERIGISSGHAEVRAFVANVLSCPGAP